MQKFKKENEELQRRIDTMTNNYSESDINIQEPGGQGMVLEKQDIDKIKFQERFAYRLEHYGEIKAMINLDTGYF